MVKLLRNVVLVLLLIVFVSIVYNFRNRESNTVSALTASAVSSREYKGVFIRDEEMLLYSGNGVLSYNVSDGGKVGNGTIIADVYPSDEQLSIKREKAKLEWLKTANFSSEERMDLYYECAQSIEEYEEDLLQLERGLTFCSFLRDMISEAEDEVEYGKNPLGLDPAAYIYIGIECGSHPTLEDLEK